MSNGTYFTGFPKFCAGCGSSLENLSKDYWSRHDFLSQCSHSCSECGAHYIHIHEDKDLNKEIQVELNRY